MKLKIINKHTCDAGMKVGIIGAGAWGTALAIVAARAGNKAVLWSSEEKTAREINKKHKNDYLPGIVISHEITATTNISDMRGMDIWLITTPTEFFKDVIKKSRSFWKKQPIIICAKGIEPGSGKLLSDVVADIIPGADKFIGVLSGPQYAGEVADGEPTGSTIAGDAKVREASRCALRGLYLEDSNDMTGVQLCGIGKNAVALLLGYLDGQGAGENERALKLTLAWQEIMSFSRPFRVKPETFGMLCGIGDLFLTASSKTSRNYSAGFAMAKKRRISGTVEGIAALKWIIKTARTHKLGLPILSEFAENVVL
ncbi:MAG: NAD(P)-binding domain-containing protein [Alphaproteobacteria bacterium]|nr:NAD(P)-binding domain-containing protein [Alphaproteobacteria bacterium]